MTIGLSEATITAQNTGTDAVQSDSGHVNLVGNFGNFVGTVHVQRRFGASGDWIDVASYTASFNKIAKEIESETEYRIFCKTGNYTSGSGYFRVSY